MTLQTLEQKFDVPPEIAARWIRSGTLRAQKVNGRWIVKESDFEQSPGFWNWAYRWLKRAEREC